MKKLLYIFIGIIMILIAGTAYAVTPISVPAGGTGAATLTGCLTGNGTSPITGTGSACGSGGGSAFSWSTTPNYNSTSTVIGFLNGLFSNATTTLNTKVFFPSLTQGFGFIGSNGFFSTIASSSVKLSWFNNDSGFLASIFADAPLSGSGTSGSHLILSTAGTWSGNAGTATALAANGTNCSAGDYARGVDASGNAENCTTATVGTVTSVTGTFPISSSGGATPSITFTGLGTSSAAVIGNLPYFSGVNTFANIGTSTPTVTSPITYSGTLGSFVGGVGGAFACATCALTTRALTVAGTANQITSSAGSQDLSADRTWTLSLPSLVIFPSAATSTQFSTTRAYFGATATTTIDLAGNIVIPSGSNLTVTGKSDGCATWASGVLNSTGSVCGTSTGLTFYDAFTHPFISGSATTTIFAIGTSTMSAVSQLSLGSSTAPQLGLFAGAGVNGWTMRNAFGTFYLSTTSVDGLATSTTPAFVAVSNGNIGIGGVSSPLATNVLAKQGALLIAPSNATTSAGLTNGPFSGFGNLITACENCGGSGGNLLSIGNYGGGAAGINTFSARGTIVAPTATQLNDAIYFMGGRGFGSTVWNGGSKVVIQMMADENFTDTANGTRITFETTPNLGTTRAERMRIDSFGSLNIATTTSWLNSILTAVGTTTVKGQINSLTSSTTASATQNIDWSTGNTQSIMLTANTVIVINATSSNPVDGGKYTLKICQDGTGSRTLTWTNPANLRWMTDNAGNNLGTTTITATANKCTWVGMIYTAQNGNNIYNVMASSTNRNIN